MKRTDVNSLYDLRRCSLLVGFQRDMHVGNESALSRVIDLIYASALDHSQFVPAFRSIMTFTGATAGGYVAADPASGTITSCRTVDVDPDFTQAYLGYYAAREVRLEPALAFSPGAVMTEGMLLEPAALRRSEIYNDLLLPSEVPHFMFAWLHRDNRIVEAVALEHTLALGAFDEDAMSRFSMLLPHLTRSLDVCRALAAATRLRHAHQHVLDALPFGTIVLGHDGVVLACSRPAEELLQDSDAAIKIIGSLVRASRAQDEGVLQRAITESLTIARNKPRTGQTLRMRGPRTGKAVAVTVIPIQEATSLLSDIPNAASLLLVADPNRALPSNLKAMQATYGLTRAEARLADELCKGLSLREATLAIGISGNTGKTQLRAVFAKMGCKRQADVVRKGLLASVTALSTSRK